MLIFLDNSFCFRSSSFDVEVFFSVFVATMNYVSSLLPVFRLRILCPILMCTLICTVIYLILLCMSVISVNTLFTFTFLLAFFCFPVTNFVVQCSIFCAISWNRLLSHFYHVDYHVNKFICRPILFTLTRFFGLISFAYVIKLLLMCSSSNFYFHFVHYTCY